MPAYRYRCTQCQKARTKIVDGSEPPENEIACSAPGCAGRAVRSPEGPRPQRVEKLDNGAMPRALERLADAERLYSERSKAADPLAGGATRPVHDQ